MPSQFEISRVTRSKQQAITAYNQLSRWYDWFSIKSEWPLTVLGLHKLKVIAGETVLEIGFGTGNALLILAEAVSTSGKVIGVDISTGMFNVAREKISRAGLSPRINLHQGDAITLPFLDGVFDAVFISFTLELFDTPDIPLVLAEIRRVLKSTGRICVVSLARDARENFATRIYEWFHRLLPVYVDCRPIYIQPALAQAGLQVQDVTRKKMWGLPVEICIAKNQITEESK